MRSHTREHVSSTYCQYAGGLCDQPLVNVRQCTVFFLYPSRPPQIAKAIHGAVERNRQSRRWLSWEGLDIPGQIVFCEICKTMRATGLVAADITTLNYNVLFEIGYCFGLGKPILPIRDTTYVRDDPQYKRLGLFDTLRYQDFQNSQELERAIVRHEAREINTTLESNIDHERPMYLLKSPIDTEGSIRLLSTMKKSAYGFRTFDPRETSRLSVHEARRQVSSSVGIIVHLIAHERQGALVHNGRCAFVAGIAMAAGKHVLMIQEGTVSRPPIDYRDVVFAYDDPHMIRQRVISYIGQVQRTIELSEALGLDGPRPRGALEALDIGDVAAENEMQALQSYFVPTAEFNQARRGQARLIVGRKGSGKTAIFYRVRDEYASRHYELVLDLKPEGHQFVKLRDAVLSRLSPGSQQHVLTAFWTYLLLCELAHSITTSDREITLAHRDALTRRTWDRIRSLYEKHVTVPVQQGDFSERLLSLVDDIIERYPEGETDLFGTGKVTELVYREAIIDLESALTDYLRDKDHVWLLFDNLDKSWPTRGATDQDILILRSLLEATRKLQDRFERTRVEFRSIVFLRNDIYEHLILNTPDRGKETVASLDWTDQQLFREIVRRRMNYSLDCERDFAPLWREFFAVHVRGEDSFQYMLGRTLMRPRDLLNFITKAIQVAVNRDHDTVLEQDILQAERSYSDDMLQSIIFEMNDVYPGFPDIVYEFLEEPSRLARDQIGVILGRAEVPPDEQEQVTEILLWFSFLGLELDIENETYMYSVGYDLEKLKRLAKRRRRALVYVIHPAFRLGLECKTRAVDGETELR